MSADTRLVSRCSGYNFQRRVVQTMSEGAHGVTGVCGPTAQVCGTLQHRSRASEGLALKAELSGCT
jgi:hypothetical protein